MNMQSLDNKNIGVFFGGKSSEHDISIVTGMLVMRELEKTGITYEPIYITTDGSWCIGEQLRDSSFLKNIHSKNLYDLQNWSIDTRHREPKLIFTKRTHFFKKRSKKEIDIVFPTFHGAFGEDGSFQGLCEMLGVPYAGCDVLSSAVSMDKVISKKLISSLGIGVTKSVDFTTHEWTQIKSNILKKIEDELSFPLFVKPPHAGSSIGISKVNTTKELVPAIDLALSFDSGCLVEEGVSPMTDLTCSVRENKEGKYECSLVQESKFVGSDFFTYKEKYLDDGGAQLGNAEQKIIIPAEVNDTVATKIQEYTLMIAKALHVRGISRIDYLYDTSSDLIYFNEINPLPGTLYHHLWKKSGVETASLIKDILTNALAASVEQKKKSHYFSSKLLSTTNSTKLQK